jgi:AbrB family looped-hinge helix DNA binding protein
VTRKGQATIPSELRKKFGIEEGDRVIFEETQGGLVLKPAADIEDSAGALSGFAKAKDVLDDHLQDRKKSFR